MKSFKQYFEARQLMMFSTKPVELYHGTTTGKNDETLNSFLNKGIVSTMSSGYGQGHGFYVFSDVVSARKQAVAISKGTTKYRSLKDNVGKAMVVVLEEILNPEDWDIDYEINKTEVLKYLINNFEKVKDKLQSDHISVEKTIMGLRPWEKPDYYKFRKLEPHPLAAPSSNDEELELEPLELESLENWTPPVAKERPLGLLIKAKGVNPIKTQTGPTRSREVWNYGKTSDGNMMDGETIGIIMNLLQKNDPQIVHSFEELFFANMKPKVAIKYVGQKTLKPKRIEILDSEGHPLDNQLTDNEMWKNINFS